MTIKATICSVIQNCCSGLTSGKVCSWRSLLICSCEGAEAPAAPAEEAPGPPAGTAGPAAPGPATPEPPRPPAAPAPPRLLGPPPTRPTAPGSTPRSDEESKSSGKRRTISAFTTGSRAGPTAFLTACCQSGIGIPTEGKAPNDLRRVKSSAKTV